MAVFVSRPVTMLGGHSISREEVTADVMVRHAGHPRAAILPRVLGRMPATRRFSRPWAEVLAERSFEERNEAAYEDLSAMGITAARGALEAAGLRAGDITGVITSHATGDAVPGLDIRLQRELGLADTIRRRPMTQLGCGGGAHALSMAVEQVAANPGARVLVVAAECLSSLHHHSDESLEALIYKALWGDSGAAVIVSDRQLTAGLRVEGVADTWEYVLPASQDRYRKRTDPVGVHFESTRAATDSVNDSLPALTKWLTEREGTGTAAVGNQWGLDFPVSHTGGARILEDLAAGLGMTKDDLRHSWDSLMTEGNLGGPAVLRVLERTYATPPTDGAVGVVLGFGPGFTVSALRGTWRDAPAA